MAQSVEATGDLVSAAQFAKDALELCVAGSDDRALDPIAARIALEVLVRAGELDSAVLFARGLSIGPDSSLMIGSTLARLGRFDEAHDFVDKAASPERDAILGYLLLLEGKDAEAVRKLRAALQKFPDDADSAHNLSIALWRLGSSRKSVSAALQARKVAPGREDVSLHFFELLLSSGEYKRVDREISSMAKSGVVASARLLVMQARARLKFDKFARVERVLEQARQRALEQSDQTTAIEVESNLIRLRAFHGKLDRGSAVEELVGLHHENSSSQAVVVNLAQTTFRKSHAAVLRAAYQGSRQSYSAARTAFIEYQLATLEGDTGRASEMAQEWLKHEPRSPQAISAALVALGIGSEMWVEASKIALKVVESDPLDKAQLNNAAYVLAMSGMADRALTVLEPVDNSDFVVKATLGLAYLASGNVERGMKLYREAAARAEKRGDDSYCLMAAYQALVVQQLGLLDHSDPSAVSAMSLPQTELPADWQDNPEFLRLHAVATRKGLGWPLAL
ncbi:MAG: hypothetical protein RIC81_03405 [Microcella pacifica]|uniref:hypothetical protein n=1 Tax=Microcella pacifica TaxID=2591847 RepID=UPI0033164A10